MKKNDSYHEWIEWSEEHGVCAFAEI